MFSFEEESFLLMSGNVSDHQKLRQQVANTGVSPILFTRSLHDTSISGGQDGLNNSMSHCLSPNIGQNVSFNMKKNNNQSNMRNTHYKSLPTSPCKTKSNPCLSPTKRILTSSCITDVLNQSDNESKLNNSSLSDDIIIIGEETLKEDEKIDGEDRNMVVDGLKEGMSGSKGDFNSSKVNIGGEKSGLYGVEDNNMKGDEDDLGILEFKLAELVKDGGGENHEGADSEGVNDVLVSVEEIQETVNNFKKKDNNEDCVEDVEMKNKCEEGNNKEEEKKENNKMNESNEKLNENNEKIRENNERMDDKNDKLKESITQESSIETTADKRGERYVALMQACMRAFTLILSRYPWHFKSQYRLAHIYFHCTHLKVLVVFVT